MNDNRKIRGSIRWLDVGLKDTTRPFWTNIDETWSVHLKMRRMQMSMIFGSLTLNSRGSICARMSPQMGSARSEKGKGEPSMWTPSYVIERWYFPTSNRKEREHLPSKSVHQVRHICNWRDRCPSPPFQSECPLSMDHRWRRSLDAVHFPRPSDPDDLKDSISSSFLSISRNRRTLLIDQAIARSGAVASEWNDPRETRVEAEERADVRADQAKQTSFSLLLMNTVAWLQHQLSQRTMVSSYPYRWSAVWMDFEEICDWLVVNLHEQKRPREREAMHRRHYCSDVEMDWRNWSTVETLLAFVVVVLLDLDLDWNWRLFVLKALDVQGWTSSRLQPHAPRTIAFPYSLHEQIIELHWVFHPDLQWFSSSISTWLVSNRRRPFSLFITEMRLFIHHIGRNAFAPIGGVLGKFTCMKK